MMRKNVLFAAVALVALVNCTSDERIGGEAISPDSPQGGQGAIVFSTVSKGITRAGSIGADAAEVLNKNFVVFGTKTSSSTSPTTQTVFDNYQANFVSNSAHITTSNSAGWEYVGYTNLPNGVPTNVGVTTYANNTTTNTNGIEQTIKYWDYSADHYDFFAYSLGKGVTSGSNTTYAKASALQKDNTNGYTYTLSGNTAELSACYISDLLKKTDMNAANTQVNLQFQQLVSKLRIGLYEIIPGYSVKDVKFYPSATASSDYTAYLYVTEGSLLPPEGTFIVTFDANGKPQVALDTSGGGSGSGGTVTNVSFGKAQSKVDGNKWDNWASKEYREVADADTLFLGRTSNACTISEAQSVLPNPNGSKLNLKVDYTLVSRDGNGETIQVTGATATVPAEYAKWQPGYSYTYLFKISDNTNGTTGQDILGLSPITLDAVVNTGADGKQETITTVTNPSITTYQKGSDYATTNEYKAGTIYVVVSNGTAVQALTVGDGGNAKLYTATIETDAAQGITEASVANALAQGTQDPAGTWTVTDANGKKLTVTEVGSGLTAITTILANDAPHGEAVNINGASFTAEAGKTYVFEYIVTDNSTNPATVTKYYKVIKVAAGS